MPFESITKAPFVFLFTISLRFWRLRTSPWISASNALILKHRSSPSVIDCTSAPLLPRHCRGVLEDFHCSSEMDCFSPSNMLAGAHPARMPIVELLSGLLEFEASAHTTTARSVQGTRQLGNFKDCGVLLTSLTNLLAFCRVPTVAYGTSDKSKPTSAWKWGPVWDDIQAMVPIAPRSWATSLGVATSLGFWDRSGLIGISSIHLSV